MDQLPLNELRFDVVQHIDAWSVHIYSKASNGLEDSSAVGGTGTTKNIALAKALSEYVERAAFINCKANHVEVFPHSTGFAARPWNRRIPWFTKILTRSSSYLECCERFCVYRWWDDPSYSMTIEWLNTRTGGNRLAALSKLGLDQSFDKLAVVRIASIFFLDVFLIVGFLPSGGFVCGSAAGWIWQRQSTIFRAASELMRHFVMSINLDLEKPSESMYIEKMKKQVSGSTTKRLIARLASPGNRKIKIPRLAIDEAVDHKFKNAYYVHRCVLKNQPDALADNENIAL